MKTVDLLTKETYIVKGDMLLYKGKKYTFDDIAPKWKKDCRTWLWKNKKTNLDELQKDFEKVGIWFYEEKKMFLYILKNCINWF